MTAKGNKAITLKVRFHERHDQARGKKRHCLESLGMFSLASMPRAIHGSTLHLWAEVRKTGNQPTLFLPLYIGC